MERRIIPYQEHIYAEGFGKRDQSVAISGPYVLCLRPCWGEWCPAVGVLVHGDTWSFQTLWYHSWLADRLPTCLIPVPIVFCPVSHLESLVDTRNARRRWAVGMPEGCIADAITVPCVELSVTNSCGYQSSFKWGDEKAKEALSWSCRAHRDIVYCMFTEFESRALRHLRDLGAE
jgi:hypothetical protein